MPAASKACQQSVKPVKHFQILHYAATEEFKLHHDYFDPVLDPPGQHLVKHVAASKACQQLVKHIRSL
jgi:hypothetical protein